MNVPVGQTQPGLQFDEHCAFGLWFLFVHDSGQVGAHSVNVLSFGHVLAIIITNENFDLTKSAPYKTLKTNRICQWISMG